MQRRLSAVLVCFLSLGCIGWAQDKARVPLDALDPSKLSPEDKAFPHPKEMVAWLRGHNRAVASLAFSNDSKLLASSSWDSTVRVWRFGETLPRLIAELPGSPSGLAMADGGKTLLCGGKDESLHVWDIGGAEVKYRRKLPGHKSRPFAVAYSPSGDLLVSACNEPVLRIWKWHNGQPEIWGILTNEETASIGISSLSFSADGKLLAAGSYAGAKSLRLWDVTESGLVERTLAKGQARLVCFSPAGRLLALDKAREGIEAVELSPGGRTRSFAGHASSTLRALAFSPDGKTLASSAQDRRVALWNVATTKLDYEWRLGEEVKALAFAPDGRHMAWGNEDGSVYIIRLK